MKAFLALLVFLNGSPFLLAQEKKLNVLFVAVDDMNCDLACYGSPIVKSPNIDRLASMGVRFDRAYCQFPLCSPSRSSLMTGLRPDTTRVFDLKYHFRKGLPDAVTLSQMFMNSGYYAARVGKIYHYGNPGDIGTSGLDDPASWQEFVNPAGRDKTALEPDVMNYTPLRKNLGDSMAYLNDRPGKDEEHTDGKVATEAIRLLEAHKDKPFFLAVGFYKPHCPWITPGKYFDLYSPGQITLPEIAADFRSTVPAPALASTRPWPYYGVTPDQARECKLAYYAAISFVDAQIGHVLDAVDRLGLAENTIIVFWSDHGFHLGEHGLWMKQSCFEEAARVPVIIVRPGHPNAGKTCHKLVELVDLYPTLADLAGLKAPAKLEGFSMKPLLEKPEAAEWNHAAFTQVQRNGFPGYSIRTERWRYTEWDLGEKGRELYDHDADPQETHNLAGEAGSAKVIEELHAALHQIHPVKVAPPVVAGAGKAASPGK